MANFSYLFDSVQPIEKFWLWPRKCVSHVEKWDCISKMFCQKCTIGIGRKNWTFWQLSELLGLTYRQTDSQEFFFCLRLTKGRIHKTDIWKVNSLKNLPFTNKTLLLTKTCPKIFYFPKFKFFQKIFGFEVQKYFDRKPD